MNALNDHEWLHYVKDQKKIKAEKLKRIAVSMTNQKILKDA